MVTANVYLYFDGDAEAAFTHYREVFGGELDGPRRFRDFADDSMNVPEEELDRVAHVSLPLGGSSVLMATDIVSSMGDPLRIGNNVYITIAPQSAQEARAVYEALSAAGGRADRPLAPTPWAELHGECTDRFGVHWLVDFTGDGGAPG